MKRIALAIAAVAAIFALLPAAAMAAAPTATTGSSLFESTTSEAVAGTANPQGNPGTTCAFEYGTSATNLSSSENCISPPAPGSSTDTTVDAVLSGLTQGTTYYYQLVENSPLGALGTGNGGVKSFVLPSSSAPPVVSTAAPTNVAGSSVTLNGSVTPNNWPILSCTFTYTASGGSAQTVNCAGSSEPSGTSAQAVSADLTNVVEGTAYTYTTTITYGATNSPQTLISSSSGSFTTMEAAIGPAASLTSDSATLQGSVNPEGQTVTACTFTYGPSFNALSQAPCSVAPSAITGTSPTLVTAMIKGLSAKTTYIQTVVLTTAQGIAVAPISSFTTTATAAAPKVSASSASDVSGTTATLHGDVDAYGEGIEGCEFVYSLGDLTTTSGASEGVGQKCDSTPGTDGSQSVSTVLNRLAPGKRYYYVLYFYTYGGLVKSNVESFTTPKDSARPAVSLHKAVINAKGRSASFSFGRSGSVPITGGYQCALATVTRNRVGRVRYARCGTSKVYKRLRAGRYEFLVRAGNGTGFGPARSYRFTI